MPNRSPLASAKANAVSVCGKILAAGQTLTVSATAIGDREKLMEKRGRIKIRPSNEKGKVQILCMLTE